MASSSATRIPSGSKWNFCSAPMARTNFKSQTKENMKRILSQASITLLLGLLPLVAQAKLKVVATTPDFGSVAEAVGGDKVDVVTLARPTEDPHFVDAKPSFIVKLTRADALVEGGAELEIGWLPPLLDGARNAKLATPQ